MSTRLTAPLQRPPPANLPARVARAVDRPGRPLDAATRDFMEPRFGHDFASVRVHTDDVAAESARAVGARAYTVGDSIVVGERPFSPHEPRGRELLGHELAHAVQQRCEGGAPPSPDPNGPVETSARAAGRAVARGDAVATTLPSSGVGLACEPDGDVGFLDPDPDVERAKRQDIEAAVEKRAANAVPQMIVREVRRLDQRLKTPHYPGRSYDLRWRDYLKEEMAKRAIPEVPGAATRPGEDEDMPKPAGYDMADDQVVEGAVVVPELELGRRIAELNQGMHDADAAQRQRAEDESRPTRMLALRQELIEHGRAADEWAKLLQGRLPFRDMQILRRYGLAWNNRWVHRGYNQADILAAVEKYIDDVAPDNAGDERVQIARADGSVLDTQRKYVDVIRRREEIEAVSRKIEAVAQSGPVASAGRLGGAIVGAPFGKSEEFSEWGAMFGQLGDVAAPFVAQRLAVTGEVPKPAPRPPAAIVRPAERDPVPTPDPPGAAGPVPASKPPPPAPVATPKPVVEPPAKPPAAPAGRPQLQLQAESVKAPEVIGQERVVDRRQQAVRTATTALNEASADAAREQSAVAAAERVLAEKQAAAQRQRAGADKASAASAGAKRTSPESKDATAKRNASSKADREVAAAQKTVDRAKRDLATAQRAVTRRTQQAKNARDALKTSEAHLQRLRAGAPTRGAPRGLSQVQPARQFGGMGGATITDPGYEGRRRDDPPLGMQRAIFSRTDGNYRRMLSGRPPIGIDGEPVNLHHRTRGPMSQLDEYTETEHRTLDLHEAGLDSLVDREAFDEQRARYWITRARDLLEQRAPRQPGR